MAEKKRASSLGGDDDDNNDRENNGPRCRGVLPEDLAMAPKAAAAVVVAVKAKVGDGDNKEAQTAARGRDFLPFMVELPGVLLVVARLL